MIKIKYFQVNVVNLHYKHVLQKLCKIIQEIFIVKIYDFCLIQGNINSPKVLFSKCHDFFCENLAVIFYQIS